MPGGLVVSDIDMKFFSAAPHYCDLVTETAAEELSLQGLIAG
jgi:hypothetical protein